MKKRGETFALKLMIELVVGVSLFLILIYAGRTYGTGEVFQKAFIARDSALLIETMIASPGNGYIAYPASVSDFSFDISDHRIKLSLGEEDPLEASYRILPSSNLNLDKSLANPDKLILSDTGNISISSDKAPNLNIMACPSTGLPEIKSVFIDPAGSPKDKESKITTSISHSLYTDAGTGYSLTYSRQGSIGDDSTRLPADEIEKLRQDSGLIIHISAAGYSHNKDTLKIYHSKNIQSQAIACRVMNSILGSVSYEGASIIPDPDLDPDRLEINIEAANLMLSEDKLGEPGRINSIGENILVG